MPLFFSLEVVSWGWETSHKNISSLRRLVFFFSSLPVNYPVAFIFIFFLPPIKGGKDTARENMLLPAKSWKIAFPLRSSSSLRQTLFIVSFQILLNEHSQYWSRIMSCRVLHSRVQILLRASHNQITPFSDANPKLFLPLSLLSSFFASHFPEIPLLREFFSFLGRFPNPH